MKKIHEKIVVIIGFFVLVSCLMIPLYVYPQSVDVYSDSGNPGDEEVDCRRQINCPTCPIPGGCYITRYDEVHKCYDPEEKVIKMSDCSEYDIPTCPEEPVLPPYVCWGPDGNKTYSGEYKDDPNKDDDKKSDCYRQINCPACPSVCDNGGGYRCYDAKHKEIRYSNCMKDKVYPYCPKEPVSPPYKCFGPDGKEMYSDGTPLKEDDEDDNLRKDCVPIYGGGSGTQGASLSSQSVQSSKSSTGGDQKIEGDFISLSDYKLMFKADGVQYYKRKEDALYGGPEYYERKSDGKAYTLSQQEFERRFPITTIGGE